MVLVTDEDTKKAQEYQGFDKCYEAVIDLSLKTDTRDIDFHASQEEVAKPSYPITIELITEHLQKLVPSFILPIPSFSAKKVAGKRLYKSARQGNEIQTEREMRINGFIITSYERPLLKATFDVGSGTFIRSIAHWLGQQLGSGGVIRELRRTSIADWQIDALPDLITFEKNDTNYRTVKQK